MSAATRTAVAVSSDWQELASREADGLQISLVWNESVDRVKVTVHDERSGESLDLDIAAAEALSAFHHPFAYAASRRLDFGDAMGEPVDLQPQTERSMT